MTCGLFLFFFQAEDGIRDHCVTGVQTCALPISIEWGVTPIWIPDCKDVEDLWNRSVDAARESGLIEPGDTVVITAGTAVNRSEERRVGKECRSGWSPYR